MAQNLWEALKAFGKSETARIKGDDFYSSTVANNATYQRRAELTMLLMDRIADRDKTFVCDSELYYITERIKAISDYTRQRTLRYRWQLMKLSCYANTRGFLGNLQRAGEKA